MSFKFNALSGRFDLVDGGITTTVGDARYLKLDASNDPLTGDLTSNNNILNAGYLRVGSTTAPTNTTAGDITGVRLNIGNAAQGANLALIESTFSTASNNARGMKSSPTFTGSGAGAAGFEATPVHQPSATVSSAYGFINITKGQPDTGVTITNMYAGVNRIDSGSLAGSLTNVYGLSIFAPSFGTQKPTASVGAEILNQGSASITTTIGLDIKAQTTSTTTIGLRIAAPTGATSYALQLSDTGGTAAGGITFGTDVTLYRSAANQLRTDDAFASALNIHITTVNNGIFFDSTGTFNYGILKPTAGTSLEFRAGGSTARLTVDSTDVDFSVPVVPTSSDGAALGTTSLMWSDLFLASGAVINFNNGDITLTHSADTLTLAGGNTVLGGNLRIDGHAYFDAEVDDGNSGASDTIDWTTGNNHKSTMTGDCTYTFTAPSGPCHLTLKLVQDGTGSRNPTWPATVKWAGGAEPTWSTAASSIDVISFYFDGTNYYGAANTGFA